MHPHSCTRETGTKTLLYQPNDESISWAYGKLSRPACWPACDFSQLGVADLCWLRVLLLLRPDKKPNGLRASGLEGLPLSLSLCLLGTSSATFCAEPLVVRKGSQRAGRNH
jgi:hypothetical protein